MTISVEENSPLPSAVRALASTRSPSGEKASPGRGRHSGSGRSSAEAGSASRGGKGQGSFFTSELGNGDLQRRTAAEGAGHDAAAAVIADFDFSDSSSLSGVSSEQLSEVRVSRSLQYELHCRPCIIMW